MTMPDAVPPALSREEFLCELYNGNTYDRLVLHDAALRVEIATKERELVFLREANLAVHEERRDETKRADKAESDFAAHRLRESTKSGHSECSTCAICGCASHPETGCPLCGCLPPSNPEA